MLAAPTMTPRPRPPAQARRSTSRSLPAVGASPPPPYALKSDFENRADRRESISSFPSYLGSPLPATLQRLSESGSSQDDIDCDWLNEKSREELAELLLKAGDLIKERETELGVTSAVCKSLHESNLTLKTKHDALVSRIPASPFPSPPISNLSFDELPTTRPNSSFDADASPRVYVKRHSRRISVSPSDISLLSDQNAELMLKLETLEAEAQSADRTGRRALKQLEKELSLLRDELEKTQAKSEQLEQAQAAPAGKIVEEMWRKKKEREAKFRAMRGQASTTFDMGDDAAEIRDFAPPGMFSKASLSASPRTEFAVSPSYQQSSVEIAADASYGPEPGFEHPHQHSLVSQLLSKIQELEETNARIIQQQEDTADKLHAVQRETESISKVYEYFSAENGMEWEVVGEDGFKSPMEGIIRFRSFRRTLEAQADDNIPSSMMPRSKVRKSVLDIFGPVENEAGPSRLAIPPSHSSLSPSTELSPLRFDTAQFNSSPFLGPRPTLQVELGDEYTNDELDPFVPRRSIYDLSFSLSPSPSPGVLSFQAESSDTLLKSARDQSTPAHNALELIVEPPSPAPSDGNLDDTESLRNKSAARFRRMSQTLSRRTSRWANGRFPNLDFSPTSDESTPKRQSVTLPQRLSSALDVVMESFSGAVRGESDATASRDPSSAPPSPVFDAPEDMDKSVVKDDRSKKQAVVGVVLEVWLWLQFAIIILVFLFAMAKQGPRSVIGEAEKRALDSRR